MQERNDGMESAFLILGVVAGGIVAFLILRPRIRSAAEAARRLTEAEGAAMAERLRGREELLQQTRDTVAGAHSELAALREELTRQTGMLSAAEEKTTRIPELEKAIAMKEVLILDLQAENSGLRTCLAQTATQREEERKAGDEKLALLEDARRQLSDAFSALSAEAHRTNNQSFLELARITL
jgi:DNA recombination protein RmuC